MSNGDFNCTVNHIRGIIDDVLRDLHVRRKCRDLILPLAVPCRLASMLESGRQAVMAA